MASVEDLDGNVLAARVEVKLDKNGRGSFHLGPADSFNFDMDRPRVYRMVLNDGRKADIETQGFHLLDNTGTNFVSFRFLNGLDYPTLPTSAFQM